METTKPRDSEAEDPTKTSEASAEDLFADTPIGIVRSMQAYLRDLPTLLTNRQHDRWCVLYCGDERIGIAEASTALIRECNRRQLRGDQYYIGIISPQDPEEWIGLDLH